MGTASMPSFFFQKRPRLQGASGKFIPQGMEAAPKSLGAEWRSHCAVRSAEPTDNPYSGVSLSPVFRGLPGSLSFPEDY